MTHGNYVPDKDNKTKIQQKEQATPTHIGCRQVVQKNIDFHGVPGSKQLSKCTVY